MALSRFAPLRRRIPWRRGTALTSRGDYRRFACAGSNVYHVCCTSSSTNETKRNELPDPTPPQKRIGSGGWCGCGRNTAARKERKEIAMDDNAEDEQN